MRKNSLKAKSNAKQVIISIAIALVTVFFVVYTTHAIYPNPKWDDFCEDRFRGSLIDNRDDCEAVGGRWEDFIKIPDNMTPQGYCDENYLCQQEYEGKRDVYERNLFFVNIILGLLILMGAFLFSLDAVSNGFMTSGVILMVYGSIRYWGELSDLIRSMMLGIVLAILVYLAYKKFGK